MTTFSVDPHRLEDLLNHCIDFAKRMVDGHGEFHPFGGVIDSVGTLTAVGGYTGDDHPKDAEVYLLLQDRMKAQFLKGEIIAAAIAANVNIPAAYDPPFPDGIRVLLECRGYSRFIYMPYRISSGGVEFAEFFAVEVPPSLCAAIDNS